MFMQTQRYRYVGPLNGLREAKSNSSSGSPSQRLYLKATVPSSAMSADKNTKTESTSALRTSTGCLHQSVLLPLETAELEVYVHGP